tara:strand:+ start:58025 stop:58777 length:753 start_codon:yes stop_codon:yes gene_type:complete
MKLTAAKKRFIAWWTSLALNSESPKTILALDPSLQATGWAIFKDGELLDSGSLDTPTSKYSTREQLEAISTLVDEKVFEYVPGFVVTEAINVAKKFTGVRGVSLANGAVISSIYEPETIFYSIPVQSIKASHEYESEEGEDSKQASIKAALGVFGIDVGEDDNRADAMLIGRMACRISDIMSDLREIDPWDDETIRLKLKEHSKTKLGSSCVNRLLTPDTLKDADAKEHRKAVYRVGSGWPVILKRAGRS